MAAHLSDDRNIKLMIATLTLLGYQVCGDAIGGTYPVKDAVDTMETELALAEVSMETDHEPFLHAFANAGNAAAAGPWKEAVVLKMTRALAIVD